MEGRTIDQDRVELEGVRQTRHVRRLKQRSRPSKVVKEVEKAML